MSRRTVVPAFLSIFAAMALAAAPATAPAGGAAAARGAGGRAGSPPPGSDAYVLGPDSKEQPGVPKGKLTPATIKSQVYGGREFKYQVYVPAQYDGTKPAAL